MDEHGDGVALSTSYFPSPRSPFDGVRRQRPAKLHPPPPSHRRGSVLAPRPPAHGEYEGPRCICEGRGAGCDPKDESGDPSGNDRDDAVARQCFHEQVSKVRLHPLRRRTRLASSQCTSQHHSPRLEARFPQKRKSTLSPMHHQSAAIPRRNSVLSLRPQISTSPRGISMPANERRCAALDYFSNTFSIWPTFF